MSYATDHAQAYKDILAAGVAATLTRTTAGSYDPEADTQTPSTTTVAGAAIRGRGNPHRYDALGLVESQAPTLYFAPQTFDSAPAPGDEITWDAVVYTVRDVDPVAPDGNLIMARLIVTNGGGA